MTRSQCIQGLRQYLLVRNLVPIITLTALAPCIKQLGPVRTVTCTFPSLIVATRTFYFSYTYIPERSIVWTSITLTDATTGAHPAEVCSSATTLSFLAPLKSMLMCYFI